MEQMREPDEPYDDPREPATVVHYAHGRRAARKAWISVDERLPEPGTECLVYGPHWFSETPCIRMDCWDEQREAPVSFSTATVPVGLGWCDSAPNEVTHWMPIPPPPSPKETGNE